MRRLSSFLSFCLFSLFSRFSIVVTTIIITGFISTTIQIFVPIQKKFNFITHFTTHFTTNHYQYCHPPPTTFSVPKRNTGKCFERPAKILRGMQSSVTKRNTGKCLLTVGIFNASWNILFFYFRIASQGAGWMQRFWQQSRNGGVGVGVGLTIRF